MLRTNLRILFALCALPAWAGGFAEFINTSRNACMLCFQDSPVPLTVEVQEPGLDQPAQWDPLTTGFFQVPGGGGRARIGTAGARLRKDVSVAITVLDVMGSEHERSLTFLAYADNPQGTAWMHCDPDFHARDHRENWLVHLDAQRCKLTGNDPAAKAIARAKVKSKTRATAAGAAPAAAAVAAAAAPARVERAPR